MFVTFEKSNILFTPFFVPPILINFQLECEFYYVQVLYLLIYQRVVLELNIEVRCRLKNSSLSVAYME